MQAELYGNIDIKQIHYSKEIITDTFYINISGKLNSESMKYKPKGPLKFNEFSIQIKLESEILASKKRLLIYDINEKPQNVDYDEKYGIVTFSFVLNAEYIENLGGGHGAVKL